MTRVKILSLGFCLYLTNSHSLYSSDWASKKMAWCKSSAEESAKKVDSIVRSMEQDRRKLVEQTTACTCDTNAAMCLASYHKNAGK